MRESFKDTLLKRINWWENLLKTLLKRILIDYVESSKLYKYRYISYIYNDV